MKNIVITDKDIPLELFKESVIVNLNNIKYSACTGDYTCDHLVVIMMIYRSLSMDWRSFFDYISDSYLLWML